ncbi:MAG: L-threonylcarbamoyladenylate synthase [Cyclobacteriaceae bacterium]
MADIGTDIDLAISLLQAGNLVGIPTETVYGLAGNALDEEAILKIYKAKNRPKFDPLIAHASSMRTIRDLAINIPDGAEELAKQLWPGPLTLLLEKSERIPDLLTSGLPRVAFRIPNHPTALNLLRQLDFPLAAPSANPFGYVSPVEASHVDKQLGERIKYILDGGPCTVGLESTIVGFRDGKAIVHRLGGTSVEEIQKIVGNVEVDTNNSSNPAAPGMLKSHYSPGRKLILGDIEENAKKFQGQKIGIISFEKDYDMTRKQFVLSLSGNLEEAAGNLFKALRFMDDPEIELILAEQVPNRGLGLAINDRLKRASV